MKRITKIIGIDPQKPDPGIITQAAQMIRQGAVVVFPTSGLYGLGADALNARAVERIFNLKGRDPDKPLLVLIDSLAMLDRIALPVNALARHLMARFWPGRVTLVVPARADLPPGLSSPSGNIGVRQVAHPVAAALVRAVGSPLTGTSANLSGSGGCATVDRLEPALLAAVDLVLDAGPLAGGMGSTVVEVGTQTVRILRHGAVTAPEIMAAAEQFGTEEKVG